MRVFGLIGYPLGHSFSKKYFTGKFEEAGIVDCRYELFPLESIGELPDLVAKQLGLQGLNVTIPYKEEVLSFLDETDDVVKGAGACNCILLRDGKLYGYNTDVVGFRDSFVPHLLPHHRRALILGTGGAAKAVAYVLRQLGISFRYVSRRPTGPEGLGYDELDVAVLAEHTVVINCTPLGTHPAVEAAPPIPYGLLTSAHYLFDLVYNPPKTVFLLRGEQQGATIENGHDMLRIQAEESWKIWNR